MDVAAHIAGLASDALICLGSACAIILVVLWIWQVVQQLLHRHSPDQ
ncbi:unnamed protein product [Acidocella sp. C78]|nr:hypothetical protein [Acidocella sp. C78]CAG4906708.1 unnamed protein product [Acidocella sp. C78]